MSLLNYPNDATPEEVAAYKLGKHEALVQISQLSRRVVAYEIALSKIKRATDVRTTFEISATALTRGGAS